MKTVDLLLEIGAEEIPAGYLAPALEALNRELARLAEESFGLKTAVKVKTWGTPNRLAAGVWGLPEKQDDIIKEVTGPPVSAAYDSEGNPTKAALGFARGQGVEAADLEKIRTDKGEYVAARKTVRGRAAAEILAEALPSLILGLPFPKTMRWGRGETAFVRPIHWILAVLDGQILPFAIGDITASNWSRGHRFQHHEKIELASPDEYEEKLSQAGVIVSMEKRREMVRREIDRVLAAAGENLAIIPDEELIDEVANLVERPVGVRGRFDDSFLALPEPVLVTAMREHQRYFAVKEASGTLSSCFMAINNTLARDMALVTRGHERVLRARLDDARFHFNEDRKRTLESRRDDLKRVVFHTLLGASWDKVTRVAALAGFLADRIEPRVKADVIRAAELCKCDLVTGLVGEFPSLQGVMGRVYAELDGEKPEVVQAIYEHYLPVRAGGGLPVTTTGAILALADKIETISGCFAVGLVPTGAADPYALRRQVLGVINIILDRKLHLSLEESVREALRGLAGWITRPEAEVRVEILDFFRLRLKNQVAAQGASTDGAEAVLSLHSDNIITAAARVWALEDIKSRPDFANLAVAFKRVVNIIKKFGAPAELDTNRLTKNQEQSLFLTARDMSSRAEELERQGDYQGLINLIVGIKPEVDNFFDEVLVDDPDPAVKQNRLALLSKVADLFARVADFSKISA